VIEVPSKTPNVAVINVDDSHITMIDLLTGIVNLRKRWHIRDALLAPCSIHDSSNTLFMTSSHPKERCVYCFDLCAGFITPSIIPLRPHSFPLSTPHLRISLEQKRIVSGTPSLISSSSPNTGKLPYSKSTLSPPSSATESEKPTSLSTSLLTDDPPHFLKR